MFKRLSSRLVSSFVSPGITLGLCSLMLLASLAQALPSNSDESTAASSAASSDSDADSMGYDAIVNSLTKEQATQAAVTRARQPTKHDESSFDSVWMHGGVGFANYIESVRFSDGTTAQLNQKGIQAALGIDLFSPNWMAEGTARSFAEDGDAKVSSSVHEFELKILYKDRISPRLGYRAGAGLTGRYLTIKRLGFADEDYTTPTSVATLGGDAFLNDRFSLGADINARNSLIGETIDHNSFDLTLRVDAHF
jgi:hypothetical protein